MALRVSVGVAVCSWTPVDPVTESWCGVAGNDETSYVGSSAAPTAAPSRSAKARTAVERRCFAERRCMEKILQVTMLRSACTAIAFRTPWTLPDLDTFNRYSEDLATHCFVIRRQ